MTWVAILLGAIPGAALGLMDSPWTGAISYGLGIFVGRFISRVEFRDLIEKAKRL